MTNKEITTAAGKTASRPADAYEQMRQEMNRLFDRFDRGWPALPRLFGGTSGSADALFVGLDVRDDGKSIVVEAELPGVDEKDVKVTYANGVLSVSGEKKIDREEKKDNYYLSERSFGSFSRSVRLPDGIDEAKIEARFDKGVLKVTAAKKPEALKSERTIAISKG